VGEISGQDDTSAMMARRGVMLIIASPSGAGKTSITRALLQRHEEISLSVSVTTRKRRSNETDGVDYHFQTVDEFEFMRERDQLLEWACVHDNFYGTPRAEVDEKIAAGRDVVFDIDWQGTLQLYECCRADMVTVFVLPPSIAELKARLEHRAQDSADVIARRLQNARSEMGHYDEYDHVIINRDLDASVASVSAILTSARLSRPRLPALAGFVAGLQAEIDRI
jgi:guanylate kinase